MVETISPSKEIGNAKLDIIKGGVIARRHISGLVSSKCQQGDDEKTLLRVCCWRRTDVNERSR